MRFPLSRRRESLATSLYSPSAFFRWSSHCLSPFFMNARWFPYRVLPSSNGVVSRKRTSKANGAYRETRRYTYALWWRKPRFPIKQRGNVHYILRCTPTTWNSIHSLSFNVPRFSSKSPSSMPWASCAMLNVSGMVRCLLLVGGPRFLERSRRLTVRMDLDAFSFFMSTLLRPTKNGKTYLCFFFKIPTWTVL